MYEYAIIGAGMSGISIAHFLRNCNIVVLERGDILVGASGNNAGFIVSGFGEHFSRTAARWGIERAAQIQRIHLSNHARISELAARIPCDYARTGSYQIAANGKELADLRESFRLLSQEGFAVEWIEDPPSGLRAPAAALHQKDDGVLDPIRFWSGLAADLPIRTNCEVRSISRMDRYYSISTSTGDVDARGVIFCLNAFAADLCPPLAGRYIPIHGQMLEMKIDAPPASLAPMMMDYGDIYWRFRPGALLFGGLADEQESVEGKVSPDITRKQLDWIRNNLNFSGDIIRSWASTMAFTVDGFPFVGALDEPNQYVLSGLCGLGHGYAMECAE